MPMGAQSNYEFIRHNGLIGAVMPKPDSEQLALLRSFAGLFFARSASFTPLRIIHSRSQALSSMTTTRDLLADDALYAAAMLMFAALPLQLLCAAGIRRQ